jgi:hypothetical protein
MVVQALLPSPVETVAAGLPDSPAAVVFVVGGDVADRLVQSNGIVFGPHSCYFGFEKGRFSDGLQVRPLALDVTEGGLDPPDADPQLHVDLIWAPSALDHAAITLLSRL